MLFAILILGGEDEVKYGFDGLSGGGNASGEYRESQFGEIGR